MAAIKPIMFVELYRARPWERVVRVLIVYIFKIILGDVSFNPAGPGAVGAWGAGARLAADTLQFEHKYTSGVIAWALSFRKAQPGSAIRTLSLAQQEADPEVLYVAKAFRTEKSDPGR